MQILAFRRFINACLCNALCLEAHFVLIGCPSPDFHNQNLVVVNSTSSVRAKTVALTVPEVTI